jgi:hypothetical protein
MRHRLQVPASALAFSLPASSSPAPRRRDGGGRVLLGAGIILSWRGYTRAEWALAISVALALTVPGLLA